MPISKSYLHFNLKKLQHSVCRKTALPLRKRINIHCKAKSGLEMNVPDHLLSFKF